MEKFVVQGGVPLSGTFVPAGNKNGALPIVAATLLTDDEVVLRNVPRISDVEAKIELLADLGASAEWIGDNEVAIRAGGVSKADLDPQAVGTDPGLVPARRPAARALRPRANMPPPSSAGTSSAAAGSTRTWMPSRAGRARSSATTTRRWWLAAQGLRAGEVFMDEPSVMGTENALLAAALTPGETSHPQRRVRAARGQDLARMLVKMGADIDGIGSNVLHCRRAPTSSGARRTTIGPRSHRDRLVHGDGRDDRRRDSASRTPSPTICG